MRQRTNHHWFRYWLVAWTAPSHYLKQWWIIVNWTLRNKLQWNFNRNSNIFIQENALEHVVCEMDDISSRPQCVKQTNHYLGSLLQDFSISSMLSPMYLQSYTESLISACQSGVNDCKKYHINVYLLFHLAIPSNAVGWGVYRFVSIRFSGSWPSSSRLTKSPMWTSLCFRGYFLTTKKIHVCTALQHIVHLQKG